MQLGVPVLIVLTQVWQVSLNSEQECATLYFRGRVKVIAVPPAILH